MKPTPKNAFFSSSTSIALRVSFVALASALSVSAATFTWDGGGVDANSATSANWDPDIAVVGNSDVIFNAAGVSGTTVNWTSGNIFSMTFGSGASAYTMTNAGGFQFNQANAGTIVNNSSVTQTFGAGVSVFFGGNKVFAANTGNLSFGTMTFRADSMTAGQTNTLNLTGASNGAITGIIAQSGAFTQLAAGNSSALTKTGSGTWTLSAANTFNGATSVTAGVLALTNNLALQNSPLTISGTGSVTLTGTTPTLGGLRGNTNLVSGISSGYPSITALTLNVLTNTISAYSGVISDGAAGMTLTKTGEGTQILSATNTYTGATTLSAGALSVGNTSNLGAAASNLVFNGGTLQITGTALTNFSTIGHAVSFAAGGTVGLDIASAGNTFTADQVLGQTTGGLTKSGAGTLILNQANTFTGAITVNNGTLTFNSTTGALAANALTFGGTSRFNVDNVAASADQTLSLGALTFSAGEGTVQTTRTVAFDQQITFASLAARTAGATGNFVNTTTNSPTNGFVFTTAPTPSTIINSGLSYNGSAYAAYDATGFVRGLIYGTDTNALASVTGAQTTLGAVTATTDAQYVGSASTTSNSAATAQGSSSVTLPVLDGTQFLVGQAITGTNINANTFITAIAGNTLTLSQATATATGVPANTVLTPYNSVAAQTTATLNTLNLSGAGASVTLAAAETLGVGGILRSGNNTGVTGAISGGTSLTAATAGGELVVRANLAADTLTVSTPIANNTSASSLTKTGAGFLNLTGVSSYTGATRINGGTLRFNRTAGGVLSTSSAITVAPGATLQLAGTSGISSLASALTLSGNGSATSYSLELPSGNTQTYNLTGGIALNGGAVIRVFGLVNTYNFNTVAITGNATASGLNFRSEGANTINQPHIYNINVAATYTGNTSLLAFTQAGIIRLGVATNALPVTTSLNLIGGGSVNSPAILDLNARIQTLAGITGTPATGGARVINNNAAAGSLIISNPTDVTMAGNLGGVTTANPGVAANNFSLTKSNIGRLTLTGLNTYTGATSVTEGVLATNGASIPDAGALVISGTGTVSVTGTETVASLTLAGVAQVVGTYNSGNSAGFITSGSVLVTGGADYSTWISSIPGTFSPTTSTADADGDGLTNQQEYAFGLIPNSGSSVNPISVPLNTTTGVFKYTRRLPSLTSLTYNYQFSTNLGSWSSFTPSVLTSTGASPVEEVTVTLPAALLVNPSLFIRVTAQ